MHVNVIHGCHAYSRYMNVCHAYQVLCIINYASYTQCRFNAYNNVERNKSSIAVHRNSYMFFGAGTVLM